LTATFAILGPGTLGLSFARHAAEQGFRVRIAGKNREHAEARLDQARSRWRGAQVACTPDPIDPGAPSPSWIDGITACRDIEEALAGADVLLEALPEDLATKTTAWRRLDGLTPPAVLRLTGTSSLSIRAIREGAGMAIGLLGFHLFVPVRRMRVVELAREAGTSDQLLARAADLSRALALRLIPIRDQPGLAASRMALAQGLEAMRLLEEGVATATDLDALMVLGYGHPVGPLELSDRIGLDLRLAIAEQLHRDTQDPRFEVPAILRTLVQLGHTGRTAGQGFHDWDSEGIRPC